MKRLLLALLFAALAYTLALASAATLNVTNSSLGSGTGNATSCDGDGVGTTYAYSYSAGNGYTVTGVTLTGLDTSAGACGGKTAGVTLTDGSNADIGHGTATVPTAANTANTLTITPLNATPPATSVAKVFVVIG